MARKAKEAVLSGFCHSLPATICAATVPAALNEGARSAPFVGGSTDVLRGLQESLFPEVVVRRHLGTAAAAATVAEASGVAGDEATKAPGMLPSGRALRPSVHFGQHGVGPLLPGDH